MSEEDFLKKLLMITIYVLFVIVIGLAFVLLILFAIYD